MADDLTQAAQRAREVWPGPVGEAAAAWLLAEASCHAAVPEVAGHVERLIDSVSGEPDTVRAFVTVSTLDSAAAFAEAVLSLPVSAPDRDTLVDVMLSADSSYDMVAMREDTPDGYGLVEHLADALIAAGLVRTPTVTPEQIEQATIAAAEADMQHEFEIDNAHYIAGNNRSAPVEPDTWGELCESDRDDYRRMVRAAVASLGLSVVEGGA